MNNIILRYGLLSGLAGALLMLGTALWFHRSGQMEGGELIGYTGMIISMVFVYMGVRAWREQHGHGAISFGQAVKVGGLIALISCVLYVVAWMLVSDWLMPDFMDKYITHTLEKMRAAQTPEVDIQKAAAEMEQFKQLYANPLYKFGLTLLEPLPVALLATLVSAALLRKKPVTV